MPNYRPPEARLRAAMGGPMPYSPDEAMRSLPELEAAIARARDPAIRGLLMQERSNLQGLIMNYFKRNSPGLQMPPAQLRLQDIINTAPLGPHRPVIPQIGSIIRG